MRVARAKRRWMRWCRYVDKTQSQARNRKWGTDTHNGQVEAFSAYMYAHRFPPRGVRYVHIPPWGTVR